MAVMDYSQQQRVVIDGTGRILDTTMTNPNTGSWVSEQRLKTWINTGMATDADLAAEVAQREADISDVKNACDALDKRVENLEEKAGDYTEVDVKSVYSVPTGKASNMVLVGLRGVSRARNQLVNSLYTRPETYGLTREATADGGIRIYGTCTLSTSFTVATIPSVTSGHSYLTSLGATLPSGCRISTSSDDKASSAVSTLSTATSFGIDVTSGLTIDITLYPMCRDLTLYFNGSIPSDADTIAEIQTNYPWLLTPSSYGTSMVKTRYEGFTSVGVNIWDEEWEIGNYGSSGEKISGSSLISKNMIPVKPSTAYYFYEGFSPAYHNVYYYDENGTYISKNTTDVTAFTTPSNCYFMNFALAVGYGTSYRNDITIAKGSTAVTYHPHMESALSLPTPIELGSAGSVAEKAYLNEDGEAWKTNPIGSVDLGSLNWTLDSGIYRSNGIATLVKLPASSTTLANIFCVKYMPVTWNYIDGSHSNEIAIKPDGLIGVASSSTPTGTLYYELATPSADTPLTVLTDNWIATEGGGTLEATKTYPIDDSFTVGYLTL